MTKHLLRRTKCYLAGNIENSDAPDSWRDLVKTELADTGIIFFDPLKKPFMDSVNEDRAHMARLAKIREEGRFDELSRIMRKIRVEDLSLVDRSDFLIAVISAKKASWGTAEEVFWANRMKKPIYLVASEGKKGCPFWIFGTLPADQIYDDIHEVIEDIRQIDSGQRKLDLNRWKIFREEFQVTFFPAECRTPLRCSLRRSSFEHMNATPTTRRLFLKTTALAAATAPWITKFASTARADDSDRKLNFAVCGLGSLATNQIAPGLLKTKNCRLAGIVTGHPAKAEKWKAQYNIPDKNIYNYDTMEKMADNPDIDVVYVVTPNALHAEHTIKAAKAGKHVLCEKPMEVSVEKCQQMIDACKAANRLLAIGYRSRFDPLTQECIKLARKKVFGETKMIQAGFGFRIGDPTQWRLKRDLAGGGALMDVGIYALQATRYLSGEEPTIVTALETKTDPVKFKEVDESITWQLKFPSGIIANCSTTYMVNGTNFYTALAERGSFGLNPAYSYEGNRAWRSDGKPIEFPEVDQFAAEMDDFAQCILQNKPSRVSGEEGLRDIRITTAIYESIRTGAAQNLV